VKGKFLNWAAALLVGAASAGAGYVYAGQWGSIGAGAGQFVYPCGVAIAPASGYVYVSDSGNHRVQYFTAAGSFLGKWGSVGSGNGQFYWPEGVAFAPARGYVYVADSANDRIQYFTPSGSFLGKWGSSGYGNGQFRHPEGVAFAPASGYVFVSDYGNHRIQYFRWRSEPAVAPASVGKIKALFR